MGWTYLPCNSTGQRTGAGKQENGPMSSSCSCMIGPFSNNSLAMGVLVCPFFLLFSLVTGNSTGYGACTSRRAATSLSGS